MREVQHSAPTGRLTWADVTEAVLPSTSQAYDAGVEAVGLTCRRPRRTRLHQTGNSDAYRPLPAHDA
jgi:hypothetical protein